jgi:HEAT repeat protein
MAEKNHKKNIGLYPIPLNPHSYKLLYTICPLPIPIYQLLFTFLPITLPHKPSKITIDHHPPQEATMGFFSSRKIEKMVSEHDINGLNSLLEDRNSNTRLQAAFALAELNDGSGWRYLMDTASQADDPDLQAAAAGLLGDLGHARSIPVLEEALKTAKGGTADAIKRALESIGGQEGDEALRRSGYEPVLPHMAGNLQMVEYEGDYVRSIQSSASQVQFLTAQQHLDQAWDLYNEDLAERALVEDSLALWLTPESADAWYLRGALFEELERYFEAVLSYRWALDLDPRQNETRDALSELEQEHVFPDLDPDTLLLDLASDDWSKRRDAAAGLGDLGELVPDEAVSRLTGLLQDDMDREVRHAAIEALGNIGNLDAVEPLLKMSETSWLLRFALIEAVAELGTVDGLVAILRREMKRIQMHNPVFSSEKDPLLNEEFDLLMEIGALAFEKTGDFESLLTLAEGNAWEEVEEEDEEGYDVEGDKDTNPEEDQQADEELEMYVDEVAQMASLAFERLAMSELADLSAPILRRLAAVPDLTLLNVSTDEETDAQPIVIHDLSALREAAKAELEKR